MLTRGGCEHVTGSESPSALHLFQSNSSCIATHSLTPYTDPHLSQLYQSGSSRASRFRIQNTKVFNPCCFDGNCTVKYKAAFALAESTKCEGKGWAVEEGGNEKRVNVAYEASPPP